MNKCGRYADSKVNFECIDLRLENPDTESYYYLIIIVPMTLPAYVQKQGKIKVPTHINTISLNNKEIKTLGFARICISISSVF